MFASFALVLARVSFFKSKFLSEFRSSAPFCYALISFICEDILFPELNPCAFVCLEIESFGEF